MNKRAYLSAAAIIAALAGAQPSAAHPLGYGGPLIGEIQNGLLQNVHRWHCQQRKGWYKGKSRWHRHPRACRDNRSVYPYPGYYWEPAPLPYYGYHEWRYERRNWLWD
jgi:hypothetical protein